MTTGSGTEGKNTGNLSVLPFKRKTWRNVEILGSTFKVVKPPRAGMNLEGIFRQSQVVPQTLAGP